LLLHCTVTTPHATDRHGGGHAQDKKNTVFTVSTFQQRPGAARSQTSRVTWEKRSWGKVVARTKDLTGAEAEA
jgi:hypothetical protein